MKTLSIHGWNKGFQKIEFTKMLQRELGYSLTLSKDATDSILDVQLVDLVMEDGKYEQVATLAAELGAIALD